MDEAEKMKCPNCKKEMKASFMEIAASTADLNPIKCSSCKECKIQIAVPSPKKEGWGSFG